MQDVFFALHSFRGVTKPLREKIFYGLNRGDAAVEILRLPSVRLRMPHSGKDIIELCDRSVANSNTRLLQTVGKHLHGLGCVRLVDLGQLLQLTHTPWRFGPQQGGASRNASVAACRCR